MNPAIKAYLATIGGAGGKATGPRKARTAEHYRAAQLKGAAARKANTANRREFVLVDAKTGRRLKDAGPFATCELAEEFRVWFVQKVDDKVELKIKPVAKRRENKEGGK